MLWLGNNSLLGKNVRKITCSKISLSRFFVYTTDKEELSGTSWHRHFYGFNGGKIAKVLGCFWSLMQTCLGWER
ncbi:MAG: hypothetical protein DM484_18400 [Candidatus Methylumidiphilus alinenensis]|uniref:Uncharacterized protein n=1 Tax=Candidatus Methylumidiphilus alinenensis TaxID=2202197 RepID=A0A2W4SJD1_9GAMM|nr:MAG: hypothetical protein DM484_18400 [Candidatus Methylumidiphilus alinenensis]